ncbi:MAG: hypothetical protein AAF823_07185 [Planctomycetota bacterium]
MTWKPKARPAMAFATAALISAACAGPAMAQFTWLPQDTDGWTSLSLPQTGQMIYVSDTDGDDNNDGLSETSAVKTIDKAMSLVRSGMPDWVVLKRGDTFRNQSFNQINDVTTGGPSAQEPFVISSYGTGDRPKVIPNTVGYGVPDGLRIWSDSVNNVAIMGIEMSKPLDAYGGGAGISVLNPVSNIHIEDVRISGFGTNLVFQGREEDKMDNVVIRRSVVDHAFVDLVGADGHSSGMYASHVKGLLIEESVFDHNGWSEQVGGGYPTKFNHNVYIQSDSEDVVVVDSIVGRGSAAGVQVRPGGQVLNSVFVGNNDAFYLSSGQEDAIGLAHNNVVTEGSDKQIFGARSWGIDLFDNEGYAAVGNIVANGPSTAGAALVGTDGAFLADNIVYNWGNSADEGLNATNPIDPTRTISSYHASIGREGSVDAFMQAVSEYGRGNVDPVYDTAAIYDYFKQGFAEAPAPRGTPAALTFTPGNGNGDGTGDGLRWGDHRNWDLQSVPNVAGDSVALNGHTAHLAESVTLASLDLGNGGEINVNAGTLHIASNGGLPTFTNTATIATALTGSVDVAGYTDTTKTLTLRGNGGSLNVLAGNTGDIAYESGHGSDGLKFVGTDTVLPNQSITIGSGAHIEVARLRSAQLVFFEVDGEIRFDVDTPEHEAATFADPLGESAIFQAGVGTGSKLIIDVSDLPVTEGRTGFTLGYFKGFLNSFDSVEYVGLTENGWAGARRLQADGLKALTIWLEAGPNPAFTGTGNISPIDDDPNLDGTVDARDLDLLTTAIKAPADYTELTGLSADVGDLNNDGQVDDDDARLAAQTWTRADTGIIDRVRNYRQLDRAYQELTDGASRNFFGVVNGSGATYEWGDAAGDIASPTGAGRDGFVDDHDLDFLFTQYGENTEYDLTADGTIDERDIDFLVTYILEVGRADINLDGDIDVSDLAILAANFGTTGGGWAVGDLNGDGEIGTGDLAILAANFVIPEAPAANAALVPEPATGAIALALASLAGRRARRA